MERRENKKRGDKDMTEDKTRINTRRTKEKKGRGTTRRSAEDLK